MKTAKERVIAIDYLRGICILIVVINHASLFSWPLTYLAGGGLLWTSAAEMFFLLSGITLWIVRGRQTMTDFKSVARKTWRRAGILYLVYLLITLASLCLALLLSGKALPINMPGVLPAVGSGKLLAEILGLYYTIGWADFLMFYAIFLLAAPFAMRILHSRGWLIVPAVSAAIYLLNAFGVLPASAYSSFAVWQLYFYLGLTIGRFRPAILGWFYSLPPRSARWLGIGVVAAAAVVLASRQIWSQPEVNFLLQNHRSGALRPLVAVLTMAAIYTLYQKYKKPLLKYTGKFVNTMGRDTLWIFVAQALVIPLLSILPLSYGSLPVNLVMTAILIGLMWLVPQRQAAAAALRLYGRRLSSGLGKIKYAYLYNSESSS